MIAGSTPSHASLRGKVFTISLFAVGFLKKITGLESFLLFFAYCVVSRMDTELHVGNNTGGKASGFNQTV